MSTTKAQSGHKRKLTAPTSSRPAGQSTKNKSTKDKSTKNKPTKNKSVPSTRAPRGPSHPTKKTILSQAEEDSDEDDVGGWGEGGEEAADYLDDEDENSDLSADEDGSAPAAKKAKKNDGKPAERSESSRESHAKQKQLAKDRKAAKPLADEIQRTKKIWERLRRKSHVPLDERQKLVAELFDIISGRMKDLVLKHDAVRAAQTAIKYGSAEQRKQITRELQGTFAKLAQGRYAKFLIAKLMVQNDAEVRDLIIREFYGKVRKLIHHPEASWILEDIYRVVATKQQRARLLREWYGVEFTLLDNAADEPTADLREILAKEPTKRGPAMKNLWELINGLVQKNLVGFSMLHDAMLQYYLNVEPGSSDHANFTELVKGDESGDLLKNMAFTRSGSRLVCLLLAHGNAKDRRALLKVFKDTFVAMSGDPIAYVVLLTAFDVIDDTKLSAKTIFPELFGETDESAMDAVIGTVGSPFARAVVYYLLEDSTDEAPLRGGRKEAIDIMKEVRQIRPSTSKKDPQVRRKELLAAASPYLLTGIASAADTLVADPVAALFLADVLCSPDLEGDRTAALQAVASTAAGNPDPTLSSLVKKDTEDKLEDEDEDAMDVDEEVEQQRHISTTVHGGKLFRTLTVGGKYDKALGQVRKVEPALDFGNYLYPVLEKYAVEWALSPSSFVIVNLLEDDRFSDKEALVKKLRDNRKLLEKAAKGVAVSPRQKQQQEQVSEAAPTKKGKKGRAASDKTPPPNHGCRLLLEKI